MHRMGNHITPKRKYQDLQEGKKQQDRAPYDTLCLYQFQNTALGPFYCNYVKLTINSETKTSLLLTHKIVSSIRAFQEEISGQEYDCTSYSVNTMMDILLALASLPRELCRLVTTYYGTSVYDLFQQVKDELHQIPPHGDYPDDTLTFCFGDFRWESQQGKWNKWQDSQSPPKQWFRVVRMIRSFVSEYTDQ